ncbi:MAG: hypothetical protein AB8B69_22615, partial [Chitinophagales bacterium]
YDKGFSVYHISKILDISQKIVSDWITYIDFFGVENYLRLTLKEIRKHNTSAFYKLEKNKKKDQKKGFFGFFSFFFQSSKNLIFNFKNTFLAFLIGVWGYLILFFSKSKPSSVPKTNTAKFEKGASGNYIAQINELNVNIEHLVTNYEEKLVEKVVELIKSDKDYDLEKKVANYLFEKGKEIKKDKTLDKNQKNQKIYYFATLIIIYILYTKSFEAGIFTLSILGLTIVISFKAWLPIEPVENKFTPDSNIIQSNSIEEQKDSILEITKIPNSKVEIYNYDLYESLIPNFFDEDNNCFSLSAVGEIQKRFIFEYDKISHKENPYFIDEFDNKYYIHVVAYNSVQEAAFQMHYINNYTSFQSKILKVSKRDKPLYAVVIGAYRGDEIKQICKIIEDWETKCLSQTIEIGCYFNG